MSKPSATARKPATAPDASSGAAAPSAPSKLDARRTRAGIGDLVAGVSLTAAPPAQRGRDAAEPHGAAREVKHPIGSGLAFERVENIYSMDPRKIVLEGLYIRQFIEDAAFQQLRAAVRLERDIGQHLGVRVVGPPTEARRVLVYGMRRWRAALVEGLEKVPVRDYGRISEEKAIELQMLENEIRADPHPVDTALGFYLLSLQDDWNQKRIAEVFDKNKGYVSEMVRVGEALAQLTPDERAPLHTAPRVTVRAFQSIAQVRNLDERRAAVFALLEPAPDESPASAAQTPGDAREPDESLSPGASRARAAGQAQAERRRRVDEAVFHGRPLRNGRSFRVRWTDDELRARAPEIIEEFRRHVLEEYTHLLHRANVLAARDAQDGEGQGTAPVDIAALVASVAKDVARVDARLAATNAGSAVARKGGAE
jgi:ParB-like chromosome segregation protein Spo0J